MSKENVKSLYLGNLDYDVTENELREMFQKFGDVKNIKLIQKKGIAFVTLNNQEDAELAMKSLEGLDFLDRRLVIDWARPPKNTTRRPGRRPAAPLSQNE